MYSYLVAKFGVFVDENHDRLPTLCCRLSKLHKRPYKSRFIDTELSMILTACLAKIKNHVIKYCLTFMRNGKNLFWSQKCRSARL